MNPVKLITPASLKPVTLLEAKSHLKVTQDDDDSLIDIYLDAATERCENYRQSVIMSSEWEVYLRDWHCNVNLQKHPVSAINSVKYYDSSNVLQTVSSSNYRLLDFRVPARLEFDTDYDFPEFKDREYPIVVNFQAGYLAASSVPVGIKHIILGELGTFNEIRQTEAAGIGLSSIQMKDVTMDLLDSYTMWL